MKEVWKDIPELKGYYKASNLGQVKSCRRVMNRIRNGKPQSYSVKDRIIKSFLEGSGYLQAQLGISALGIRRHFKVHRLVASAFIPNPENKKCVNHKNGIKTDNNVENLEWATHSENLKHAYRTGLSIHYQLGKSGFQHPRSRVVVSILDTAIIEHGSVYECARYFKCDGKTVYNKSNSGALLKGHRIYLM